MVLVTCNRRDFLALHWQFLETDEPHSGIIVVHQEIPKSERIRVLLAFSRLASPEDMQSRVEALKDWLTL
jgi:hypothetical protein